MDPEITTALQASYDRVADEYAARFFGELAQKPLDRALLGCFAELARVIGGPVADIGCGPGQIARYLRDQDLPAFGIDLSPRMVDLARRLSPDIPFHQGTILALDVADDAWGGIAAFYSVIHLPPGEIPLALTEFRRALRPGGPLLLAFHAGHERVHADEFLGHPVSIDFHFLDPEAVASQLTDAGFVLDARILRQPYAAAVEHPSQRAYLLAHKPAAGDA